VIVNPAQLLNERMGEATVFMHPATAKKMELEAGAQVKISFEGVNGEAVLKLDDTISTGVVLVPRSMGIAIREPVTARVQMQAASGKVK
jgi:anaerobic selenocysteine-containing dehydrogenase